MVVKRVILTGSHHRKSFFFILFLYLNEMTDVSRNQTMML